MSGAGGYDEYGFIADLYDFVRPYRDRQDVAFFVDAAKECGGPVLEICLESIRRHLADGGRLILDLFNPNLDALASRQHGEEVGEEPEFVTPDGRRVIRRHRIVAHDRFNQFMHVELIYYVARTDAKSASSTPSACVTCFVSR